MTSLGFVYFKGYVQHLSPFFLCLQRWADDIVCGGSAQVHSLADAGGGVGAVSQHHQRITKHGQLHPEGPGRRGRSDQRCQDLHQGICGRFSFLSACEPFVSNSQCTGRRSKICSKGFVVSPLPACMLLNSKFKVTSGHSVHFGRQSLMCMWSHEGAQTTSALWALW